MTTRFVWCLFASLFLGHGVWQNADAQGAQSYTVTITNLTRGQIISPPFIVTHNRNVSIFEPGMPASDDLALLAEDGDFSGLNISLSGDSNVFDVASSTAPILPGDTLSFTVESTASFRFLSAVGMLVTTNDAFFALSSASLPRTNKLAVFYADAWDAGSEFNSESCDTIPGPPCGNGGVRDPDDAEGFVYVHPGIRGSDDLGVYPFDWRNPVVRITVRRAQ